MILPIPSDECASVLANALPKLVLNTIFATLQKHGRDAAEQRIWPKSLSYLCTAGRTRRQWYRSWISGGSRPKTWWIIEFTWNLSPIHTISRWIAPCCQPSHEDYIHPERRCAGDAQWFCIPNWYHWKLQVFQDTLNGYDVDSENRSPVVKLIYKSRADGLHPTWNQIMDVIAINIAHLSQLAGTRGLQSIEFRWAFYWIYSALGRLLMLRIASQQCCE